MIQARITTQNQNLPDELRWQIPLLKPRASDFARTLKRDNIRVNRKNYVVLLTVDKPKKLEATRSTTIPCLQSVIQLYVVNE